MNELLTGDIWKKVSEIIKTEKTVKACIAYVTAKNLDLTKNDILICDASEFSIKMGETNANVLKSYFESGVKIYPNQYLHSKILLTENYLVIGSSNLSKNSAENLIESAVISNNDNLISQAKSFIYKLQNESIKLTTNDIVELLKIEVIKRPTRPKSDKKPKTRETNFGNSYWFLNITELKERKYKEIKPRLDKSVQRVANKTELDEDDLNTIYFKKETQLTKKFKEGDQILMNWANQNKTRNYFYPFTTILGIEKVGEELILVYDDRKEDKRLSKSNFQKVFNNTTFDKMNKLDRAKKIDKNDAEKIMHFWK